MNKSKDINSLNISRRAFISRLSQAVGYAAAASLVAGSGLSNAFAYTPRPDSSLRDGVIFTKAQMQVLRGICASVIPRTDTASAADVDCHGFVDHQLLQCHTEQEQAQCIRAVDLVASKAKEYNAPYTSLLPSQKEKILQDIEALKGTSAEQKAEFKKLKALIVFGYFTSQEGATKALSYQPYPGGFKGSVKVDENTKAAGYLAYY